jgi:hypothetical protein
MRAAMMIATVMAAPAATMISPTRNPCPAARHQIPSSRLSGS